MCRKLACLAFAALLLSVAGSASADLVGHWTLDEGSGTAVADSSGNGNHGIILDTSTVVDAPTWIPGISGSALEFYGSGVATQGGNYVDCGNDASLNIASEISIALWIRPDADDPEGKGTSGGETAPMSKTNGSDWNYQVRYGWGGGPTPYMSFTFNTSPRSWAGVGRNLEQYEWVHIACSHDGALLKCYLNGEETESTPMGQIGGSNLPVLIGSDGWGSDWIGGIDDVRIYDHGLSEAEILDALIGRAAELSYNPSPASDANDVPLDSTLSWMPGKFANSHDVYFGLVWDDVNNATTDNPMDVLVSQGQAATTYDAALGLEFGQTYYWRVDEVNGAPDNTVFKGEVWSFTAEPTGYPIRTVSVTASSSHKASMGPEKTIDGSGLDALGQHSTVGTDMWLSGADVVPVWIQYEFDRVYKLHEMRVWNSNQLVESFLGLGAKDVVVETSSDGNDWTALEGATQFAQGTAKADYVYNTTVNLGNAMAKFVRITINAGYGIMPQYGLSEVRFFSIPTHAREPQPAPGETTTGVDVVLDWRAGREAVPHQVVFSSDNPPVSDGSAVVATVEESRFDLSAQGIEFGTTYFWKIVEINEASTPTTYVGDVWSFATPPYTIVDNFDRYNDKCNRIFFTWLDGLGHSGSEDCAVDPFEGNGSGSMVGNDAAPFAEKDVVHLGGQSMPLAYDNSFAPYYSETESKAFALLQDWDVGGADTLSISLRGNPVALVEKADGGQTVTSDSGDIWGTADDFRYAWKRLSGNGSIVARVDSLVDTWPWAKAGVMIRDTLDPISTHAMLVLTPGNGVAFQYRPTTAAASQGVNQVDLQAPYWVRLTRSGDTFTAARSEDGVTWVSITDTAGDSSVPIAMATDVYIGFAVTSNNLGSVTVAEFSEISFTGTVTGQWQTEDIGHAQPTNAPAPLYVVLQDSAGQEQVVRHPDQNAVLSAQWLTWQIPLIEFASLNLSRVKSLAIGVGDRDNPSAGGAGKLYIDDIHVGKAVQ